jgi:hypothetical protein
MKKLILNRLFLFSVSTSAFAQTNYYVNDGTIGELTIKQCYLLLNCNIKATSVKLKNTI